MLPTATKFTELFDRRSRAFVREVINSGLIGQVQHHSMHEGRQTHIARADGSETISPLESVGAEAFVKDEELAELNFLRVIDILRGVGEKMRDGSEKFMLQKISESLPESQTTNAGGQKFNPDIFLDAIDRIWIDFDSKVNPLDGLTWVVPPAMMPRIREVMQEVTSNPELNRRLEAIIGKKRMEYREAEANRRLVG